MALLFNNNEKDRIQCTSDKTYCSSTLQVKNLPWLAVLNDASIIMKTHIMTNLLKVNSYSFFVKITSISKMKFDNFTMHFCIIHWDQTRMLVTKDELHAAELETNNKEKEEMHQNYEDQLQQKQK